MSYRLWAESKMSLILCQCTQWAWIRGGRMYVGVVTHVNTAVGLGQFINKKQWCSENSGVVKTVV